MAPKFGNSLQVYLALKEIVAYADREHFLVVCFDSKHKPLAINIATTGTMDSSLIHPREIFKPAILCGASSIVVAHNHPIRRSTSFIE
ncbi:JAB domain-containing protein [bacterium]|nr:JAB domain-containing protein [bacterium]